MKLDVSFKLDSFGWACAYQEEDLHLPACPASLATRTVTSAAQLGPPGDTRRYTEEKIPLREDWMLIRRIAQPGKSGNRVPLRLEKVCAHGEIFQNQTLPRRKKSGVR